jgi:hypothetical protein
MELNKKDETKEYVGELGISGLSISSSPLGILGMARESRNRLLNFVIPVLSDLSFYDLVFDIFKEERERINFFTFCYGLRVFSNYNHKALKSDTDSFIKINTDTIRFHMTSLTQDYKKFIRKLIDYKFIECDDSYSPGNFSMGYRFGPKMINLKWEEKDYQEFLFFVAPKTGHKKVFRRIPERFSLKLKHWSGAVSEWIRNVCAKAEIAGQGLTVHYPENFDELNWRVSEEKYANYLLKKKKKDALLSVDHFAANNRLNLDRISQLRFSAFIDEGGFSNRLFTEFVCVPTELRPMVKFEGETLFNVDLRCAQCCFLAAFYDNSVLNQEEKTLFIAAMQNTEIDLYSVLAKEGNMPRADAKDKIFVIMFAPNYMQTGKICRAFKKLFPILSSKIYQAKNGDYTDVARSMQTTESKIMIEGVLQSLLDQNIPAFSIHDSIMTTAPWVETVKAAIDYFFLMEMGFKPILRVD